MAEGQNTPEDTYIESTQERVIDRVVDFWKRNKITYTAGVAFAGSFIVKPPNNLAELGVGMGIAAGVLAITNRLDKSDVDSEKRMEEWNRKEALRFAEKQKQVEEPVIDRGPRRGSPGRKSIRY